MVLAWLLFVALQKDALALDFTQSYLPAARAVLAGESPYPPVTVEALAPKDAFVYPPLTAYLVAPFTALPTGVAAVVAFALSIVLVVAALQFMGVRDWRCYSIVLLWVPAYSAIQTGNVTVVIVLGLALLWRYRERTVGAVLAGLLVALKLFLWPLVLWFLATRRYRLAALSGAAAVVAVVLPWAGIGFAGMRTFPRLMELLAEVQRADGYTVAALMSAFSGWGTARAVGLAVGLAVLAAAILAGRSDERASYALCISAALLLSPLVHLHYFLVLLVILALYVRRFDWRWTIPLIFWLSPQVMNGASWQTALALLVFSGTVVAAVQKRPFGADAVVPSPARLA